MFNAIIRFYVKRIKDEKITLNDVPKKYRDKVKEALEAEQ